MSKHQSRNRPTRDLYADITQTIITAIERDPGHPQMPWRITGGNLFMPNNARTDAAYNGINILTLWAVAEMRDYAVPVWATYRQWQDLGAQVRKGEKSSPVIFYKEFEVDPDPEAADDDGKRRVARASAVFNCAQVDGWTLPDAPEPLGPIERIATIERFVASTKAMISHSGDRAYYRPSTDTITMPEDGLFTGTDTMSREEGYYATLLHELTHWTGAEHRLDRQFGKRFGDDAYAAEELVAEIASAFLSAELGITQDTRPDHAQYLAHWLKLMKSDSKAIFTAAARAAEAATYLKSLQAP